jgi:DNA polymerase-1
MIVSNLNFAYVLAGLMQKSLLSLDTETTGLFPYGGDRLFSIIIADENEEYYFNFQKYPGLSEEFVLSNADLQKFRYLFSSLDRLWFLHNAKFDLHMLSREKLSIQGTICDTSVAARLECNTHLAYSLEACAARNSLSKDDTVKAWISKNKAYTWELLPGKKKRIQKPHYDRVPFPIISTYGKKDARVTFDLGMRLLLQIAEMDSALPPGVPKLASVLANERELTGVVFEMEKTGVLIDKDYCHRAMRHQESLAVQAEQDFKAYTGSEFKDSGKYLSEIFERLGIAYARTDKGNPSFDDEALLECDHPIAEVIRRHRTARKDAGTYYTSFLFFADSENVIHPNYRQAGTTTGRFSMSDPNLQNLPKEYDANAPYSVRKCFIPRPGYCFVMIDYDQMEYRMMLDYAGETGLIGDIKNGLDVHEATQRQTNCATRDAAKTLNFAVLYGAGLEKLAGMLKIQTYEARQVRNNYFRTMPMVSNWIQQVCNKARHRGWIFNWMGRRYDFSNPEFAYKAPNALIQGGCADVVKKAMNLLHARLASTKSRMLLQIHDEILFEIHESELHIVPGLRAIMEQTYPYKQLPLTCSVSHSWLSWGDKRKGLPSAKDQNGQTTRDDF